MFKYAHKTTPIAFSSFFTPVISIHTRTTRLASFSDNLYLPRYKTNKMQRSFKFQGVKIWNSTPNDLRKLSFNQFKIYLFFFFYLFSCIFILLSRESDQCAIRARLGVAGHLSTTPRWGNPAKCLSQRHNK